MLVKGVIYMIGVLGAAGVVSTFVYDFYRVRKGDYSNDTTTRLMLYMLISVVCIFFFFAANFTSVGI